MRVFFCFSDETGAYECERSERFIKAHPYFIRSSVLLSVDDWVHIHIKYKKLLKETGLPFQKELKWSYIGSIVQHRKRGEAIPRDRPYAEFSCLSNMQLWGHVRKCLELLKSANFCKIIYTVTDNACQATGRVSKEMIYQMHIQDLMQRIEYKMRKESGLAIIFLDPLPDERTNRLIREAYGLFYQNDPFISQYEGIKDSLAYELSHHSSGIRLADYAAGIFAGFLRGFSPSQELFVELVWPLVRKSDNHEVLGYGIIDVPKRREVQEKLKKRLREARLVTG